MYLKIELECQPPGSEGKPLVHRAEAGSWSGDLMILVLLILIEPVSLFT